MKDYQFQLSYVLAGTTFYYDGTTFTSTPRSSVWTTHASAAGSWVYPLAINWPAAGTSYLIKMQVRGEDNALSSSGAGPGNISVPTSTGTDIAFFNLDDIAPTGAITFPGASAAVSSTVVHMTGPATDDLSGVQIIQVEISTGTSRPNPIGPAPPGRDRRRGSRRPPPIPGTTRSHRSRSSPAIFIICACR